MALQLPVRLRRFVSNKTQYLRIPEFRLESGELLAEVDIAYQTWGNPENAADGAILICHALSGSADVEEWWPGIIGQTGGFDPRVDFVICSNILGGCYGTTGPLSRRPGTASNYAAAFPDISVRDMVRLQKELLDSLNVSILQMVIGPSLGGMQALEWAASYPDRVRAVALIGVGGRHSPWCTGISEAQRTAIKADPHWDEGNYSEDSRPTNGLAAARMMAICTYRSWQSFETRFPREPGETTCTSVQSYLHYQGEKINERFDANTYITLSEAMHTHDVSRGRGEYANVLREIRQPALVVSVSSDALYPPEEQQLLATHLPNATYRIIDSQHGHDGFLIETETLVKLINEFRRTSQAADLSRATA